MQCLQPERAGRVRQVKCPLAKEAVRRETRTSTLQAWAEKLAAGQVHAVSVVREDREIGLCSQLYWLIVLTGPAFEAPESLSQQSGWTCVR